MGRNEAITLSLSPKEKAELEALAVQFGILWGDKPNISGLVRAIANKRIRLHQPDSPIEEDDKAYYRQRLDDLETTLAHLRKLAP